jgi:hypothetical protein
MSSIPGCIFFQRHPDLRPAPGCDYKAIWLRRPNTIIRTKFENARRRGDMLISLRTKAGKMLSA